MAAGKKNSSLRIIRAVSAFSEKLSRFSNASPNGRPNTPIRDDEMRQKKVDYHEEEYKLAVVGKYKNYNFPYKSLGSNSNAADELVKDEERMYSAYNLFKAVYEANKEFGKYETRIMDNVIKTPLTEKEQYTTGDEFPYLQCWLYFEKKARDFIPYMSVGLDGSTYTLKFMNARDYRWDYKTKELFAVVHRNFYPNEKTPFC